ncbi:MAG: iron-containing alcohol dehydrogenase [Opitutaceae bacterium]|nr:iron-containing alcohol dehydrogenase [Opitutaceae bacterium]
MLDFEFCNPTKILFGRGTVAKLDGEIPSSARVLILYGGESARRAGTLDEVIQALGEREIHEFGGIEANPTFETLMDAVELVRREKIDFLLAVGGGSVIDGVKFVAAAVSYEGDPWELVESGGKDIGSAVSFGSVLTLSATGSEMNSISVISRKETQAKLAFASPHVFPQFSILDPSKTFTLPARQVANGIVDAFSHVIEQYLTYPVEARVQDRFAEGLMQTLIEIAPKAMEEPPDYDARANLMWVATLALNGLIGAGVPQDWASHRIGHELTALYSIDHARTLAVVMPSLLNVCRGTKKAKLLQYGERIWNITEGEDDERIDKAITKSRGFFEEVGLKTRMSDYDLGPEAIDDVLRQLETHDMVVMGERDDITLDVSRRILEGAL